MMYVEKIRVLNRWLHYADDNLVQATGDYTSILWFVSYNASG
jgi:hypothetical protein